MSGTKRTRLPRGGTPGLITPQAVALFRRALDLRRRGADEQTVPAAEGDLDRLLGGGVRRLWEVSVFDVFRYQARGDADWERKMALRSALDAALRSGKASGA